MLVLVVVSIRFLCLSLRVGVTYGAPLLKVIESNGSIVCFRAVVLPGQNTECSTYGVVVGGGTVELLQCLSETLEINLFTLGDSGRVAKLNEGIDILELPTLLADGIQTSEKFRSKILQQLVGLVFFSSGFVC
jgi:hypothetical protein